MTHEIHFTQEIPLPWTEAASCGLLDFISNLDQDREEGEEACRPGS